MTVTKLTLYSNAGSQWAQVGHLGLEEKGYHEDEYDIKQIHILSSENLDPEYLKVNPNGTVPSLEYPSQSRPLIDTREILSYLDSTRSGVNIPTLTPSGEAAMAAAGEIIELVHGDDVSTNILLLQCRDIEEHQSKRTGLIGQYIQTRQDVLGKHLANDPENVLYKLKSEDNTKLNDIYLTDSSSELEAFFKSTQEATRKYAAGIDRLEELLVLPYAVGDQLCLADLHVVPWLAHAQMAVGTTDISDLDTLEKHFQKTVPSFKIGSRIRKWWCTMGGRASFQKLYSVPH